MGMPGLTDEGNAEETYESVADIAKRHIDVAAGRSDVVDLATPKSPSKSR